MAEDLFCNRVQTPFICTTVPDVASIAYIRLFCSFALRFGLAQVFVGSTPKNTGIAKHAGTSAWREAIEFGTKRIGGGVDHWPFNRLANST